MGSKKSFKKGQERSQTVNTVKNGQYGPKRTKKNWSKNGQKRSKMAKTVMVLGRSTMVLGRSTMAQTF